MSDNSSGPATPSRGDEVEKMPHTIGSSGDEAPGETTRDDTEPQTATEAALEASTRYQPGEPVKIGERRGQFGVSGGGSTSGYGGLRTEILFPGAAARPYGGYFDEIADALELALSGEQAAYGTAIERIVIDRGEMTVFVGREHLAEVAQVLRDDPALRFEMCLSVSGVHYPDEAGRELHAVYHLISVTHGSRRLRLEVATPDDDRHVPSVTSVWPGADWHERETWDMFGIIFDGHPALTRILMPDDWPGHPQRKDYPLGGVPVEYKGGLVPPPDERRPS